MALLDRPLLVVSDAHLGDQTSDDVDGALTRLVEAHAGSEVVLAGDIFDLSHAPKHDEQQPLLAMLLERAPSLVSALRARLVRGEPVTFLSGNHDAALSSARLLDVVRARLDVTRDAPLAASAWFVRRGGVHIEHGHVYDPDNAPIHPLADWTELSEPLGIALTRRFVVATGAADFSHAQDATPARSIARAFRIYGPKAPGMIANYFRTAIQLTLESGPAMAPLAAAERGAGSQKLPFFAQKSGVPDEILRRLLALAPAPTHLCRRDVFLRLYFDRVLATVLLAGSLASLPFYPAASLAAVGSVAYLVGSAVRGHDRYGSLPQERLRIGAARVRELTQASSVIFGHTHHAVVDDGYLNTGSFAFPRGTGRPHVVVDVTGAAELRRVARS